MCNLCAVVLGGSTTNDKYDVKNKIYIQITASCMVQEVVLVVRRIGDSEHPTLCYRCAEVIINI